MDESIPHTKAERELSERPLRVLITDPHLKGGGQVRYVVELARHLTRLGHHITVGCKTDSVLADMVREAGASVHNVFRYRGGARPAAWWHDVRALQQFIRDEKPDILHANGSQDHWVSALANQLMGHPVCMVRSRHNTYVVGENWANRKLNLDWTDYQIAVCKAVFDLRVTRPVFDPARMCVIHNGVDPDLFLPDAPVRKRMRAEFGYADEHIVFGIAARLAEAKGHRFLFEAAAQLAKEFPQLRLLVLGQGVLEQSLKQRARDLGIAPIVQFPGFRNDIAACMQAFDVGVQPSIDCEASSFSVMEQMATGKPIITSDHGGTKEIVRDGADGFVVPQGTVEPLAMAMRRLLVDASLRDSMGASARRRVAESFTLTLLAQRTVEAYRAALALHSRDHRHIA
ncbi:MAG TPA: glycosyltransferase [Candidatus Hydrogenedentes bacterium]|nr:glycosyltransferase [Candidatus Hydrogenedentota bacterium]HRK34866.1 glycosyltransferase [Candidatus Hydrogenedentota bacterium]